MGHWVINHSSSLCFAYRPATAPAPRQENIRREFSLDIDGIEGDYHYSEVSVLQLETNEALDDLISAPIQKPFTKWVCFGNLIAPTQLI